MFGYAIRRLISALVVLALTTFLAFTFFYKGPVNPARTPCEAVGRCTPEKLEAIEESMGFNDGLLTNFGRFAGGLIHGRTIDQGTSYQCDAPCLGVSYRTHSEVSKDLLRYYPATLSLALGGGILYLLLGLPLGVLAARYRGSWFDKTLIGAGLVIASIPYFVLALSAWIFFTLQTNVFHTGYVPITQSPSAWFFGLLLPWLILGITGAPTYMRYIRAYTLEALGEDYIKYGRARGLSQRTLLFKHALRVAVVPVVPLFGLDLAGLLSGTVFTESIFNIDGIGSWTLTSFEAPIDFPVVTATIIVFAAFTIIANLVVDLLYATLDPRVRLVS